jgi:AcrR family transcriptional regulator
MPDPLISAGHRPDSDSARERILAAAHRLFYRGGIRATGIDLIIAEAKVAKMSFYKHFPTKAELVVTFLEERHAAWMRWFTGRVGKAGRTPARRLAAVFEALEEWFGEPAFRGCAFINTIAESCEGDEAQRAVAVRHKAELRDYLESLVRAAGHARAPERADELMVLVEGAIVLAQTRGDPKVARIAGRIARRLFEPPAKA